MPLANMNRCSRCDELGHTAARCALDHYPNGKPKHGNPRRGRNRTVVVAIKQLSRGAIIRQRAEYAHELATPRPKTRGECVDGPRPCPFVSCRHHMYLEVNPETGSIQFNRPQFQPWELEHSCSLDIAATEHTLEEVGELLQVTRERARQIEVRALLKLKQKPALAKLDPDRGGAVVNNEYERQWKERP